MPETVKFLSKYLQYTAYIGGRKVRFERGALITSDKEIIEGLRASGAIGVTLFEEVQKNSIEREPEETIIEASVPEKVEDELTEPEGGDAPVKIKSHEKPKKYKRK